MRFLYTFFPKKAPALGQSGKFLFALRKLLKEKSTPKQQASSRSSRSPAQLGKLVWVPTTSVSMRNSKRNATQKKKKRENTALFS